MGHIYINLHQPTCNFQTFPRTELTYNGTVKTHRLWVTLYMIIYNMLPKVYVSSLYRCILILLCSSVAHVSDTNNENRIQLSQV